MTRINRRQALGGSLALLASFPAPAVHAQAHYPERPIRVVVPFGAGGVGDTIMRLMAPAMEQSLGQKLVIESKPGASGNIGTLEVARAQPDGYTILVGAMNTFVINRSLMKMSFDPLSALAPVAKIVDIPVVFFSNTAVPARTLGEFVAHARRNSGQLNYGSQGNGTLNHLLIERLKQLAGIDMTHIPYAGSPAAMMALLANQIQLFSAAWVVGAGHLADGKLTVLAVTADKRLPALPDVPTMTEAGLPGLNLLNWWGMAAPTGTPEPVIRRLDHAVAGALRDPRVVERFAASGLLVPTQTAEQFSTSLTSEAALWAEIIQRGKIVVE
jgi:tripartite-type tricarboxylate transporter receptor subunit TctC